MNNSWQTETPTEPGYYEFRSDETDYKPEPAMVVKERGILYVRSRDVPLATMEHFHYGLTHVHWRHQIHK